MKFYKEKTSNRDFSKTGNQNFLILAYVVGNYLNFWNFGVSIPVTFLNLGNPSQTVWVLKMIFKKNSQYHMCVGSINLAKNVKKKIAFLGL